MKAVIVEDEISSARNLARICMEIGDIDLVARLESIEETVHWFSTNPDPDILFLDIHLADGSAFEIFEKITIKCPIIFTTAFDQYALRAFRENGISYLMKPLKEEDVQAALRKFDMIRSGSSMHPALNELLQEFRQKAKYKSHVLVSLRGQKLQPLKVDDIACISIADGLVKAHTYREKIFFLDESMDEIYQRLDPELYFRANRQYIIARDAIKDLDQWFHGRLSVNIAVPVHDRILISRARVKEFKNWLAGV